MMLVAAKVEVARRRTRRVAGRRWTGMMVWTEWRVVEVWVEMTGGGGRAEGDVLVRSAGVGQPNQWIGPAPARLLFGGSAAAGGAGGGATSVMPSRDPRAPAVRSSPTLPTRPLRLGATRLLCTWAEAALRSLTPHCQLQHPHLPLALPPLTSHDPVPPARQQRHLLHHQPCRPCAARTHPKTRSAAEGVDPEVSLQENA